MMVRRTQKGMSIKQVAELCGITRSYLSKIECGHFEPSWDVWLKIAKVLECQVQDLKQ
ncbi:helix-turn-helix domain-containing protein [Sporomusa aerivorans]|uniref:helix-turn-helix domain-containing protein n=1 Tax=Sporomusa aerivorans TaxID=204936 RepID=UPI00352A4458